jgi:hypothetical protein
MSEFIIYLTHKVFFYCNQLLSLGLVNLNSLTSFLYKSQIVMSITTPPPKHTHNLEIIWSYLPYNNKI